MALALTAMLAVLMAKLLVVGAVLAGVCVLIAAVWLWPHEPDQETHPQTHEERHKLEQAT
jgi:hypothetical protein